MTSKSKMALLAQCAALVTLASCGGGGGGSGGGTAGSPSVSSPSPTPTPVPTPAPTPAASSILPKVVDVPTSRTFNTYTAALQQGAPSDNTRFNVFDPFAGMSASIDVANRAFSVHAASTNLIVTQSTSGVAASLSPIFPPSSFVPSQSDATFATYRTVVQNIPFTARLNTGAADSPLPLSHFGFGEMVGTNGGSSDYRVFSFGAGLEERDLPTTPGSFSGVAIGWATRAANSTVYALAGSITLELDFPGNNFSGVVNLRGTDSAGQTHIFGSFPITPTTRRPLSTIIGSLGSLRNSFRATVGGTGAPEAAGTLSVELPDPQAPGTSMRAIVSFGAKRS